jgi:hypothetical protein
VRIFGQYGEQEGCVPLATQHPVVELEHVVRDSNSSMVIATPEYEAVAKPLAEIF